MFLLKDNTVTQVRLEPAAPQSQVKHSTTEPLRSLKYYVLENIMKNGAKSNTPFSIIYSKVFKILLKFFLIFFNVV